MNGYFNINPWQVSSLKEFLYYNCPECQDKTQDPLKFFNHAVQSHKSASVLKDIFPDMVEKDILETKQSKNFIEHDDNLEG